MNKKIGFIGAGNMASAMMNGIVKQGLVAPDQILASDKYQEALTRAKALGIPVTTDNCRTAAFADILILAVKPIYMEEVITGIRDSIREEQVIVTLAPGKTIQWLEANFGKPVRLVRTMPNTPAFVGEAMAALCPNKMVTEEDLAAVKTIFESFGKASVVPENMIDVVTGVSGSSPAYVFMFIEALADAAVLEGMPRAQAYEFAAQAVLGSAKLVLESGKHPGELKDMVCSPGGTTIEAVRVLEDSGFRGAVIEATKACIDKARAL